MRNFVPAARLGFIISAVLFAAALIAPTAFMQQDSTPVSTAAVDREPPISKTAMTKPGQPAAPPNWMLRGQMLRKLRATMFSPLRRMPRSLI